MSAYVVGWLHFIFVRGFIQSVLPVYATNAPSLPNQKFLGLIRIFVNFTQKKFNHVFFVLQI